MAFKLTKVNNVPGELINLNTDEVPENQNPTNKYYTTARADVDILAHRENSPTVQDKHFYTNGEIVQKVGDLYWRIVSPIEILSVQVYFGTPPVGSNAAIYVQKNQAANPSDLLFNITIPQNQQITDSTDPTATLQAGDYIRVDVAQVGSTTAGSDLIVSFKYRSII